MCFLSRPGCSLECSIIVLTPTLAIFAEQVSQHAAESNDATLNQKLETSFWFDFVRNHRQEIFSTLRSISYRFGKMQCSRLRCPDDVLMTTLRSKQAINTYQSCGSIMLKNVWVCAYH